MPAKSVEVLHNNLHFKELFRNWAHVNATASAPIGTEAPAFIFNETEFIVAKGKSAPKALHDLRGKPTLGWLPVACQASSMNWLPFRQA